jgi:spermidine/putrescine transport system substrate-binding protein
MHPRDRWPWNRQLSRREVLRLGATAAASGAVLAACGGRSAETGGGSGIVIGTPENPVRQPLFDENPPIESNLEPEKGPLRIYNWADYIWTRVLKDFASEYGVEYELTTFYNLEEATRKLRTGKLNFDIFFPTAEVIPKFVAGQLFQPLNHDYLPNLRSNVWPRLVDPYYDVGSRYTTPYVLYETGIAWRADMVEDDIAAMDNPWEVFWNPDYKGVVGLYDDYRETIGVGMYRSGVTDINSARRADISAARDNLIELSDLVNVRYTIDGTYVGIPEEKFAIHHSWSGDIVNARFYFPKGGDPSVLRYVWPPNGNFNGGYISNDAMAVLANAEHPVLAHHFMNFLLDEKNAIKNFSWLGYQPPLKSLDPDSLVAKDLVPEVLKSAVIRQEDFGRGQAPVQLTPQEDAAWLQAWSQVQSGG